MVSIIISGMAGVGKSTVAEIIAKKLKIEVKIGGDVLKDYAAKLGYKGTDRNDFWDTEEGKFFLKLREKDPSFDKKVDEFLKESISSKEMVITSWSLPWLVENSHVKVWLKGSQKTRAKRISERDNIPFQKALEIVKERDNENFLHYKRLYGIELDKDYSVFNLVIDTEIIEPDVIGEIIIIYYKAFKSGIEKSL
ncbi:MAG: cytidylate kinase family protein [Nitrososphaeria archaeon]|nr:cytidylate kinase family protein [Conexivisphaerales archaeon]